MVEVVVMVIKVRVKMMMWIIISRGAPRPGGAAAEETTLPAGYP